MELKNTEKLEHSVVALTIEITKAEFEAAKDKAFMNDCGSWSSYYVCSV